MRAPKGTNTLLLGLYEQNHLTHEDAIKFVEAKLQETRDPGLIAQQLATEAIARVRDTSHARCHVSGFVMTYDTIARVTTMEKTPSRSEGSHPLESNSIVVGLFVNTTENS